MPIRNKTGPWTVLLWTGAVVVIGSLAVCMIVAATHSLGLSEVGVIVVDPGIEMRDHIIPLVKQKDALPDYEVVLILTYGGERRLGSKPNTSAEKELVWRLEEPESLQNVASVQLRERGILGHGAIAEVQPANVEQDHNGYRFRFATKRSFRIGVESFFATPIGRGIVLAFFLAVLLMLVGVFGG